MHADRPAGSHADRTAAGGAPADGTRPHPPPETPYAGVLRGPSVEPGLVKQEQRTLSAEKDRAFVDLDAAPERIVPGEVRVLVHALVVPVRDSREVERCDGRVEDVAVRVALSWERDRGREVRDVSTPELARLAGLPDWPGFDLLSTHPEDEVRNIEVKGRAGQGSIQMQVNEWKQACRLGERYWLYVVFYCATPAPRLVRVRNPFARLAARSRGAFAYRISAGSLIEAAEPV